MDIEEKINDNKNNNEEDENSNGKKSVVNSSDAFMKTFWDLASPDNAIRIEAANNLVNLMRVVDMNYTINRLVRGLTSSRAAARQGFSLALAQLIRINGGKIKENDLSTKMIIENIEKTTKTEHISSPQEIKDRMIGKVFGIISLIRSGRLSTQTSSQEEIIVIKMLLNTNLLKAQWIEEIVYQTLISLFIASKNKKDIIPEIISLLPDVAFIQSSNPNFKAESDLDSSSINITADALGLIITMQNDESFFDVIQESDILSKYPKLKFLKKSLVRIGKLNRLAASLKQSCSSFPRIHSVWSLLFDLIFSNEKKQELLLKELWNEVIENILIANNGQVKKCTAILIFENLLDRFVLLKNFTMLYKVLLSRKFLSTIIYFCGEKKSSLNSVARRTMRKFVKIVTEDVVDDKVREEVVNVLLTNGHKNFDLKSNTSTVKSILGCIGPKSICSHIELLMKEFDNAEATIKQKDLARTKESSIPLQKRIDSHRVWIIESISSLLKLLISKNIDNDVKYGSTVEDTLCFFMENAFLKNKELGEISVKFSESKFYSLFHDICTSIEIKSRSKHERFQNYLTKTKIIFEKLAIKTSSSSAESISYDSLRISISNPEIEKAFDAFLLAKNELKSCKNLSSNYLQALDLLISFLGLQLISPAITLQKRNKRIFNEKANEEQEEERDEDLDVFNDLINVVNHVKKYNSFNVIVDNDDEMAVDPMAVTIDILLSLLAQPSSLTRDIVKIVFSNICNQITFNGLETILNVIFSDKPIEEIEENDDDDSDEMLLKHDLEEDDENEDIIDDESSLSDEGDNVDFGEFEQDDEEKKEENNQDNEDENKNGKLSEESLRQMDEFDNAIGDFFRAKKEKKTQEIESKNQAKNFKLRVYDLLEVVINVADKSDSSIAFLACLPLLNKCSQYLKHTGTEFKTSASGLEYNRARGALKLLFSKKPVQLIEESYQIPSSCKILKISSTPVTTREEIFLLILSKLFKLLSKSKSDEFVKSILIPGIGWIYRLRNKVISSSKNNIDPLSISSISEAIKPSLASFLCGQKSIIGAQFFETIARNYPIFGWSMIIPIYKLLGGDSKPSDNNDEKNDDDFIERIKKTKFKRREQACKPFEKASAIELVHYVLNRGAIEGLKENEILTIIPHAWKSFILVAKDVEKELKQSKDGGPNTKRFGSKQRMISYFTLVDALMKKNLSKYTTEETKSYLKSDDTYKTIEFIQKETKFEYPKKVLQKLVSFINNENMETDEDEDELINDSEEKEDDNNIDEDNQIELSTKRKRDKSTKTENKDEASNNNQDKWKKNKKN